MTPSSKRSNRKTFYLNDSELAQFSLAQRVSHLSESEFMRQRCLDIIKRKRVPLSQIQIYQQLGVLQQQAEQILGQLQQGGLNLTAEGGGMSGGSNGSDESNGRAAYRARSAEALLEQVTTHLTSIKALRREVAQLDAADADQRQEQ
jgi:hypothetical protein